MGKRQSNLELVSVIIPTYSRPDNICRAIDSVLCQTYSNIEIIVVDDNGLGTGFQQETEKRLQNYISSGKIIYIPHDRNKNGSAARNTGFQVSKGAFVTYLDDDDVCLPNKIEKQVKCLEACGREFGACYCNAKYTTQFGHVGTTNYAADGNLIEDYLMLRMIMNTSALVFRREAIEQLDGFDESYIRHQDFELMTRFFDISKIKCCNGEPLLYLDWSGVRTNQPNVETLAAVEEKFYADFEDILKKNGIWNMIHHLWYFNIATKYLKQNRLLKYYEYLRKSYRYETFSKYQIKVIVINHLRWLFGMEIEA